MHLLTTFTSLRVLEQTTMSFLDFEPGTPPSCLWPATQSPFCVAQSQLITGSSSYPPESVDRPAEQSDVDTSIKSYEQEQRDWGARMGASPIQSPEITNHSIRGPKTRSSLLQLSTRCADSGSGVYSSGAKMQGGGITGAYRTRAVGQPQRRRKSGVRRNHRPKSSDQEALR